MAPHLAAVVDGAEPRAPSSLRRIQSTLPASFRKSLRSARQLLESPHRLGTDDVRLPTGVSTVDRLLGGGLPRGRLIEFTGRTSSGRFSTLVSTLATTTRGGNLAAFLDLGDGLDPRTARAAGVVLERLLWIRPRRLREALISCEMLLNTGFPLIAVDLGLPPVPGGRGRESSWLRLARTASTRQTALLVSSPYRVCSTATAIALVMESNRPQWHRQRLHLDLLVGSLGRMRLQRSREATPHPSSGPLRFTTVDGELLVAPGQQARGGAEPAQCFTPESAAARQ